jgi:hypothetical protein
MRVKYVEVKEEWKQISAHPHRETHKPARSLPRSVSRARSRSVSLCLCNVAPAQALEELGFSENGHPSKQASNSSTYNESHPWRDRSSSHFPISSIKSSIHKFIFIQKDSFWTAHIKVVRKVILISSSILWWIFASWSRFFFQSILWYRKFGEISPKKIANFSQICTPKKKKKSSKLPLFFSGSTMSKFISKNHWSWPPKKKEK